MISTFCIIRVAPPFGMEMVTNWTICIAYCSRTASLRFERRRRGNVRIGLLALCSPMACHMLWHSISHIPCRFRSNSTISCSESLKFNTSFSYILISSFILVLLLMFICSHRVIFVTFNDCHRAQSHPLCSFHTAFGSRYCCANGANTKTNIAPGFWRVHFRGLPWLPIQKGNEK